jgi:hypothetical protein
LEKAAEILGIGNGTIAILGGTEIYGLFLRRYDLFHLSRLPGLHLSAGRPVFPQVPKSKPEDVLVSSGLIPGPQRLLDVARGTTITSWQQGRRQENARSCAIV